MDGHVWRVPTLFGVMACSALLLFAAGVVGSLITRRRPSTIYKVATGAVLALLAVLSAVALRATAVVTARGLEISVTYVDPGPLGYLAPVTFAALAFAVGRRMLSEAWIGRRAVLFYAWLLGFSAANVVNRCSPGWCAAVGFPFTWHGASDAMLTFGDAGLGHLVETFDTIAKVVAVVLNVFTFVVIAGVLTRVRVRRST